MIFSLISRNRAGDAGFFLRGMAALLQCRPDSCPGLNFVSVLGQATLALLLWASDARATTGDSNSRSQPRGRAEVRARERFASTMPRAQAPCALRRTGRAS